MRSRVLYLVVPQLLILFVAELVVLVSMNLIHKEGYPDPFAPYEAMMPGRFLSALEDRPCEFDVTPGNTFKFTCDLALNSDPLAAVSATAYNGRFVQISFRGGDWYIGDVIAHWGRPDRVVRVNHRSFYVIWVDQNLAAFIDPVGPIGRFNYRAPVERFSIGVFDMREFP